MNRRYSFYRMTDGLFIGRRIACGEELVAKKTPTGCVAIEGHFDRFRQRVDLSTGAVVVDETLGAERDADRRRTAALMTIADLERRQLRPLRELAVNSTNEAAAQRLAEIDEQIATLRESLR